MNVLNRVTGKTLRKNKTRTIVTIIGVILSVAMITAITSFISSMQNFMLRSTEETEGPWQASVINRPYSETSLIGENAAVKEAAYRRTLGFSKLEDGANDSKPYLCVQELDAAGFSLLGISPIEGRLPENDGELLVSEHIWTNGGVRLAVGQTITLPIGDRVYADGTISLLNVGYYPKDEPETLSTRVTKTYTVVGVCPRPSSEDYSAAGYTVFTRLAPGSLRAGDVTSVYLTMKKPGSVFETMPTLAEEPDIRYHSNLLRYMGISMNDNFNAVLYSMAAILIVLIMVGSISLIYNAFAISVSERSKQFGMLSSAGATSRQIRNSVFYEALVISGIGIPLGVLSGIGGIGVTLYLLRGVLTSTFSEGKTAFALSVSVPAVAVAAAVGLVTVLISAYIPARRAARVSAIDAIRQTDDIKLRSRQVKTPRFIRRLFGLEGDLALKNFKRNRRRYRATVFSLFISVVLFISVSTYTGMLKDSIGAMFLDQNYDIAVTIRKESPPEEEVASFYKSLKALESVTTASQLRSTDGFFTAPAERLSASARDALEESGLVGSLHLAIYAPDDEEFARYVKELGLTLDDYTDGSRPRAVVLDTFLWQNEKNQYIEGNLFRHDKPFALTLSNRYLKEDGQVADDSEGEPVNASITLAAFADKPPLGVQESRGGLYSTVKLIVSRTVLEQVFGGDYSTPTIQFFASAADPVKAEADINNLIKQTRVGYDCTNYATMLQENRNTLLVANVLSYGFITLISLITVANVFNTISTNVNLRRREFAMLKSVGMTKRGFHRMMNFECVFYGLKALLYGLPVSFLVAYLIRKSLSQGIVAAVDLPWVSVGVAVLSVFLVVFVTMLYSMSKIRKENIIDALKNENQ